MSSSRVRTAFLFFGCCFVAALIWSNRRTGSTESSSDFASRDPAAVPRLFALGAFLPEKPSEKVYILINGREIQEILRQKPANVAVYETDAIAFPGLMDMNNHLKRDVLPPWPLAKSEFQNRFEWRHKYPPYQDMVRFNMEAFPGDSVCAAVRWGELKALVGGATSVQGVGPDAKCAAGFGVMNVEIPGDLTPKRIQYVKDLLSPSAIGNVFLPSIAPSLAGAGENHPQRTYDQILLETLKGSGTLDWLDEFTNSPRSIARGVKLTLGLEIPPTRDLSPASLQAIVPGLLARLSRKEKIPPEKAQRAITDLRSWLYGRDGRSGYLALKRPSTAIKGLQLLEDPAAVRFIGKDAVIAVDKKFSEYVAFESQRRAILRSLNDSDRAGVLAAVSEGSRRDEYTKREYGLARDLGFVRPGLILFHGVGLDAPALADVARAGVSIVWSPYSNLILYGETLDVVSAKKSGVNIALGSASTALGSKNMLAELKIARHWLNRSKVPTSVISDRDLVDMATINGARALGAQDSVGRVAAHSLANLLLLDKKALATSADPFTALVQASPESIRLVVVGGEPLYGEWTLIQSFAQQFQDASTPEALPLDGAKCAFKKGLRLPGTSALDQARASSSWRTVVGLEKELRERMEAYAHAVRTSAPEKTRNLATLDPLFECEDGAARVDAANFIDKTLDANLRDRSRFRQRAKLNDRWNPLKDTGDDPSVGE